MHRSLLLGAATALRASAPTRARHAAVRRGAVTGRVVVEGRLLTAAGASSGIDMPLRPVGMEAGEEETRALHLVIEYDPDPPFDSGSLGKPNAETQRRATEHMARVTEEAR